MIRLTELLNKPKSIPFIRYFAYGSNMETDSFEKEFPGAKAQGLVYLDNHSLKFNKWSETNKSNVANVAPNKDTKIFGILYYFPYNQLENLDKKEGGYKKIVNKVIDSNGKEHNAFYYVVKNEDDEALPSAKYIYYIVNGIKDGFEVDPKAFEGTPYRNELLKYTEWLKSIYTKVKGNINEKWSQKYKRSIDCSNPKGFSQKAHCQGRKK